MNQADPLEGGREVDLVRLPLGSVGMIGDLVPACNVLDHSYGRGRGTQASLGVVQEGVWCQRTQMSRGSLLPGPMLSYSLRALSQRWITELAGQLW